MAGYHVYIRVEYPAADGVYSQRARIRAQKASFQAIAEKWVEDMLPKHFEPGNSARYGYTSRSEAYLKAKQRMAARAGRYGNAKRRSRAVLYGGHVDLVLHGDLARDVTQHNEIKAFPTRATVKLGSGKIPYLVERPRRRRTLNMANEIRVVTREEMKALVSVQAHVYFSHLAEHGAEGKYIYQAKS